MEDKKCETQEAVDKNLNLLSLRCWHYEHPEDYQEFTNHFANAYEGDVTFFLKGMSYLAEMLPPNGIKGITELLESLCLGTDSYNKAQFTSNHQQVHEKLTALFDSTFNQGVTIQNLLHNNSFANTFHTSRFLSSTLVPVRQKVMIFPRSLQVK